MSINNQPTIKPRTVCGLFTKFIPKVIPLAFDESMSYYECLCALLDYINKNVIPALDNNAEGLLELQEFYEELQSYVNNYFDNLDVQEEINNKLDQMVEDGVLEQIIEQFLQLTSLICFDNVAAMKLSTNLANGSYAKTLGYYSVNDGGSALYKVRPITNEDVVDEKTIIAVYDELLVAELIYQREMNVECFGAKGDGTTDDSSAIQTAIDSPINTLLFGEKTYVLANNINLGEHEYIGNNTTLELTTATTREHFIRNKNFGDITKNDNITIKNIHFTTSISASILGIHSGTLIMDNCSMYADNYNTRCLLDLYGNNKNCSITNSNFKIELSDLTKRGTCIEIRGFTGGTSKNIIVSNCSLEQNSLDETLWINAGACGIENVIIDNCIIKDTGNSMNTVWVSNTSQTGSETVQPIKNVIIKDSKINKSTITDRCISISRSETSNYSSISTKNIVIDNCDIIVGERAESASSGGTNIVIYNTATAAEKDLRIRNSRITYSGSQTIAGVFTGFIQSENNIINATNATYAFLRGYRSINDTILSIKNIGRDCNYIDNLTATASTNGLIEALDSANFLTTYVKNSKITCQSMINNSGAIRNRNYYFLNSEFNCSSSIYNNWSGDSSNKLYLMNSYISTKTIVNSAACTLYYNGNYNSTGLIKGITGFNSYTLGSMPIGTVLFSDTATKTIVRKTSDGTATSNWEEI